MEGDLLLGGCHFGSVRYQVKGAAASCVLCHCTDCRPHSGAPMLAWAMYPSSACELISGGPKVYSSSEHGRRHFCADCGTGLFYTNEQILPGIIDVQTASLDDPSRVAPTAQVQVAERIAWMPRAHELSAFERYRS